MWNAPSDRKYCGQFDDDDEICLDCGAHLDQSCEEWCASQSPAQPEQELRRKKTMQTEYVNGSAGANAPTSAPAEQPKSYPTTNHGTAGFHKAVKAGAKARVALIGVSGAGKSYTMLTLARVLAGPQGQIA